MYFAWSSEPETLSNLKDDQARASFMGVIVSTKTPDGSLELEISEEKREFVKYQSSCGPLTWYR